MKIFICTVLVILAMTGSVSAFALEENPSDLLTTTEYQGDSEETTQPDISVTDPSGDVTNPDVDPLPGQRGFVTVEDADGTYMNYYDLQTGEKYVPETTGVYVIEDKNYLFMEEGKIVVYNPDVPVVEVNEKKYYLNNDSTLSSGIITIDSANYYFDDVTFEMKTGWVTIDGVKRYFGESDGIMVIGLTTIDGKTYYFDNDGIMKTGWITIDGKKRYFGTSDGVMVTGLKKISSKTYYFDKDGIMKNGWVTIDGKKRYFGTSNGVMVTGLKKISGKTYYFDKEGVMKTGWVTTDGARRYFDTKTGVMTTGGLKKISGKYYYFNSDGTVKTGWYKTKDGKRYFNTKTGEMYVGLKAVGSKSYYFNSKGYIEAGWKTISGAKYYFLSDGTMVASQWKKISGKEYYFGSDGKMAKNKIVGSDYVLKDGTKAKSNAVKYAVKVVNTVSKSGMTKAEKLKACYKWIIDNCVYARDYTDPTKLKTNWTKSYAEELFSKKAGNCYKYASAMGYCAEVLGYEAKVAYGKIASNNKTMTAHGWTEVVIDGKTYILDTVQQDYSPKTNYYKVTYSTFPKKLQKSGTIAIELS